MCKILDFRDQKNIIQVDENSFTDNEDVSVIYFLANGETLGDKDTSELDSLPWYKRIYAYFNSTYGNKYISLKPFSGNVKLKD